METLVALGIFAVYLCMGTFTLWLSNYCGYDLTDDEIGNGFVVLVFLFWPPPIFWYGPVAIARKLDLTTDRPVRTKQK